MPFTLEQLDFLSVHVGVAIPPDFLENKRRAEEFKKRSAEMATRSDEIKQRGDAAALEALLEQATAAAAAKDLAGALDLLDQVEAGLAAPEPSPPSLPTSEPEAAPKVAMRDPSKDGAFFKLQKSRLEWKEARDKVESDLVSLEQTILSECKQMNADPNEEFEFDLDELAAKSKRLHSIMDGIDERLLEKLDEALKAQGEQRAEKQKEAAGIIQEYQAFLNSDPLVARIDNSGFMNTSIRQTFVNTLTNLAANL